MGSVLSVLLDHVDAGITEFRSRLTASVPLTPSERIVTAREIAAAAASIAKLRKVLAHAEALQGKEMARTSQGACHAGPNASPHSCECLCHRCEQQQAGGFAQRAALSGDLTAADHLTPAVFAALTVPLTGVDKPTKRRAHQR